MRRSLPVTARSLAAALACAVVALTLAACGQSHTCQKFGASEGTYLCIGRLQYQVELSRQLNPSEPEDSAFLEGLPKGTPPLGPNEIWYGVFVRVENNTQHPLPAAPAANFSITDTQNNLYTPLTTNPAVNLYQYTAGTLGVGGAPHGAVIPNPDSPAGISSSGGSLLLFRVNESVYENRPITMKIVSPLDPNDVGRVVLDI